MTIDQATLAMRLRQAREHAGLTQEEAAEAVGLSRTALVQIEGVKRSVSSLEPAKLAERYALPIDSFFQDDGQPDQKGLLTHDLWIERELPQFQAAEKRLHVGETALVKTLRGGDGPRAHQKQDPWPAEEDDDADGMK